MNSSPGEFLFKLNELPVRWNEVGECQFNIPYEFLEVRYDLNKNLFLH